MENSVEKYTDRFEAFLDATGEARANSENCRDYYDHKQWSEDEIAKLKARNQAAIVVNRIKPKIDALKGMVVNQRTDPKALPRTQKHEQASDAITDALRYVNDNSDFDHIEERVCENVFLEGTGACIIEIRKTKAGIEIEPNWIPWDRFYFDPHSRSHDYSDAKYKGIVLWMDLEDAIAMFPEHETELSEICGSYAANTETYDDKPMWIDRERKRIRICQEYYQKKGEWEETFFTEGLILKHGPSPYLDEENKPMCPIEGVTAYIDRDLNRYGPAHVWLDLQDEINHRRSKALHLLSVRQTIGRKGAIQDVPTMKRELSKPNGHVEYVGEQGDFEVLPTGDMAQAQFALLEEAKAELDAISMNAQLSGERQGDLSGKAVQTLQAGGMLEITPLLAELKRWKRRCFRQVWYRVKQFWTEEKWLRVTDDYDVLRWVGLNYQVTAAQVLQERMQDESLPPDQRQQAGMVLQMGMQLQDPRLNQVVEKRNDVAALDVDIILDVQPDALTIQDEQFQLLLNLAASRPEVPFSSILKMSRLRGKDAIIEDIEKNAQQMQQVQGQQMQVQLAKDSADIENKQAGTQKTMADTEKSKQEAQQKALENLAFMTQPIAITSVAI